MNDLLSKLARARLTVLSLVLTILGAVLLIIARFASPDSDGWISLIPIGEIGSALFTTGLITILLDYVVGKINEQRQQEMLKVTLQEHASVMRDAVIDGFAFNPDDLARVSTPETLDRVIQNSLAIRLGDKQLADELYTDIRDQAVRSVERWHDAKIRIRLSIDRSTTGGSARSPRTGQTVSERRVITVRHEYTTIPATATRRFASVSDINEYRELKQDGASTFVWHTPPSSGIDAASTEAFELVQFTVDGVERSIRRTARPGSQMYSVNLGLSEAERSKPVSIAFTYRLMPPAQNRLLHLDAEQPTRGFDIELDYSDADVERVHMLDFIASSQKSIVTKTPPTVPGKIIGLEFDGWLMPKSGVAFVWVTTDDLAAGAKPLLQHRTVPRQDRKTPTAA